MPRQPTDLGLGADEQILALMAKGGTMDTIAAALVASGSPEVSPRTVARRMAALRPRLAEARVERREAVGTPPGATAAVSQPLPGSLPRTPEEIPARASLAELESLRGRCRQALDDADGDLKLIGQLIRVSAALEDQIRKATPRPVPNPNDSPDMISLGGEVAARLHAMVEMVVGG